MAVVRALPETRASSVGLSSSRREIAASEELKTTPGYKPAFSARPSYSNNAEAGERSDDIHAILARSLAHVGDEHFVHLKGNALLEFPEKHRKGYGSGARKLVEMLDENADDGIGEEQRDVFIFCAQAVRDARNRGLNGGEIRDVGFHRAGNERAGRKRLDGKAIDRAGTRPAGGGDAIRRDLDGDGRVGHGVEPAGNAANEAALVNTLAKCGGATQRKSPY